MSPPLAAIISLIILALLTQAARAFHAKNPEFDLKTADLAGKYGYPLEAHTMTTEDGYILEMHRIPYGKVANGRKGSAGRVPILLQHGLTGSSADWVVTGPNSGLAYILADKGYDVWLGNNRGNIYSRQHRYVSPENRTFWDFSFHELGVFDLPAMIDHVLKVTKRKKLLYVGHSQGMTQLLVMTSERPEYNTKIALATGLAPAAFTGNLRGPITQLARLTYFGVWVGERFGWPEMGRRSAWRTFIANLFCHDGTPTQFRCSNTLFFVTGFMTDDLNLDNITVIVGHVPAGASWKQLVHFGQGYMNPGTFRAFDYVDKEKNMRLYNLLTPPDYDLSRITAPIALFSSDNDWLAAPKDVELLRSKLRNVVMNYKVPDNVFNHYDFLWGKSVKELVIEPLLQLLDNHRR